ncbi:MAG: glycosyltransferase [Candidatus Nomurabacteria bacterium]|jgi:glycosyltransferase involved in cell wall biosynthesis|nr:glycosyltransferase [Candidatus Nomurabacteria bacterium]
MKSSSPLISVVIPVYNVEKYLDECMGSVVEQSYKNLEIILVDDGSTDSSGKMCDEWARKDTRVKVIHKKNDGLNYARRDGFRKSTGEYITFLDSDDFFHEDNIKNSLATLQETKADIAVYEMVEFVGDEKSPAVIENTKETIDSKEEMFRLLISNSRRKKFYMMTVWGKLYTRKIVEKIDWRLSNYRIYEDNFWMPQALDATKRIVIINQQLIYYRTYNDNSKPLSKQLVGNTQNGEPVGYLEWVHDWFGLHKKYIDKNKLSLTDELNERKYALLVRNLDKLIESNMLQMENNEKYVGEIYTEYRQRVKVELARKDYELVQKNKTICDQREQIKSLNARIEKLQSLRGSVRNFGGAVLRRSGVRGLLNKRAKEK